MRARGTGGGAMRCYTSVYGPFIARFVVFKRSLGYKFVHGESVLGRFDAFCAKRGEGSIGITRELSEEWGRKRDNESDPTRYARAHYLIQFASYLNDMGYPSFVPRPRRNTGQHSRPISSPMRSWAACFPRSTRFASMPGESALPAPTRSRPWRASFTAPARASARLLR